MQTTGVCTSHVMQLGALPFGLIHRSMLFNSVLGNVIGLYHRQIHPMITIVTGTDE